MDPMTFNEETGTNEIENRLSDRWKAQTRDGSIDALTSALESQSATILNLLELTRLLAARLNGLEARIEAISEARHANCR